MEVLCYSGRWSRTMVVTNEMIHPQLRLFASVFRTFFSGFTSRRRFVLANRAIVALFSGRAKSGKIGFHQVDIPRPDGSKLRCCVFTPLTRPEGAPALLWIHGGGFGMGIPEVDWSYIERFILATGCAVVSPDYTCSVTKPYPAALDDCYLALLWMRDHCEDLGTRSDQLFVGGDSAGGGLTAAVTLLARDRGEVSVAFQMPLYPMLDDRMDTNSSWFNDAPVWNSASNRTAWQLYLGDDFDSDRVSKYAAPGRETDYSGLPPTLTFVGDIEPFRDETLKYVDDLKAAGVKTDFRLYPMCFHAFDTMCPKSEPAKDATQFLMDGFVEACRSCFKEQPVQG